MEALFPGKSEMDQLNRIFKVSNFNMDEFLFNINCTNETKIFIFVLFFLNKELGTPNEDIWQGYNQLPAVQKCNFADHPVSNLRNRFATMLSEQGLDLLNK